MKLLVVEDSRRLREALASGLRRVGYAVDTAEDGETGWLLAVSGNYDVVILDLMLPKLDGLTVLRRLRERGNNVNVLVLTAKDAVPDRVAGLRTGADDYLPKPFAFEELVARIEALVRRKHGTKNPRIVVGDLVVDTAARSVSLRGQQVNLTAREYAILEYLAIHRGRVVTKRQLEDAVYDERVEVGSNVIESAISILRRKIDRPGAPSFIQTRRGFGYVLIAPEEADSVWESVP
ncbi:MAG: DNA-binding response regulator [Candidatus Hydrogenedentota bacterium]|jgi:two-component system OmpR family response regulator|uniref:Two component transcriptional regulator, winged helix family n=1 Tax=Sumerlaea chitinivorans TaxID=2250252 RepID=A0A2Z4Y4I1_SUMC1|nr:two component transcriptional regulator, winged helix family [Candidatus Sumerlaea chitinivorans]RMH27894.1 MAG: DNA-binding response regulator [Candidatus Hydrogenedentota bacterium]GIX43990.1 MAG: DNA-binding response regulator [Candidatus Sumerlaea sp.]